MKTKRLILLLTILLLVGIGFLPILVMAIKSLIVNGHISFSYYKNLFSHKRIWVLLRHSFSLSILTTFLAIIVGIPLGIIFGKTDLPFRRLFTVLFTIPLLLPPYTIAVSWFDLLGQNGFLARILGSAIGKITSSCLFGLPGCVLVLFTTFMPIMMLLTIAYLKGVNPSLEEAARLVASWPVVLKNITIPLILPGILFAAALVFLLTLGEFSVPMFFRFDVFPVESFIQFSAFHHFGAATAAAIPLVFITLLIPIAERIFFREKVFSLQPIFEKQSLLIKLGSLKWCLFAIVTLLCFIMVILPLLVLIVQSSSISAYVKALTMASDSLLRSLSYATLGATSLTILGFFLGYLIYKKEFPFWQAVDSLTIFLFALPSTVIGIGLISLWNRPETNFIYGTPAIIIFGYLAQYSVLTSRITVATLAQIPPSMEEAAQIVGAGWLRRLILIIAPLARHGLIASWLVGYIFCLRDTGLTMMVYPPGHDTLPVRTFTLMANGSAELMAALCMIMIVATLLPLSGLGFIFRGKI